MKLPTRRTRLVPALALGLALGIGLAACGDADRAPSPDRDTAADETELSAFELEHGIGPINEELVLPEGIDAEMAARGQDVFELNCEACHMMDDRFVGPALRDVLDRRSATFVMNIILNPEEMVRNHPEGQKMLQEYPLIMPYQNISEDEARAIVEYLRTVRN